MSLTSLQYRRLSDERLLHAAKAEMSLTPPQLNRSSDVRLLHAAKAEMSLTRSTDVRL